MIAGRCGSTLILQALALGVLSLTLAGVKAFAADTAIPVVADVARRADVPVFLVGLGSVAPLRTVTVTSRIDGELIKLDFVDGQDMHAGDRLAEIAPHPLRAALAQRKPPRRGTTYRWRMPGWTSPGRRP
ncbi:biotin/lipoyl-binding protein [Mesorhizobium sp. B2-4-15]|uniref:biotin/lipoyl-binding protein n=1 Tax=Mesorhizobium sp. B2-4-15 TaxID=2589934 RepID=UPI001152FD89|nr:biotin/lipoyl-binding protein [Mesorhizobium sp. B2-4-15]TPK72443.1 biotin/lipoyl-binding protein [Mesorhizobium sp. B2-4-15]